MVLTHKIICGDCIEVMKEMESDSVDLIITSPPYNLGRHHRGNFYFEPYKDNMPERIYQEWQIKVLDECFRILKNGGSMLYNHKNRIKNGKQITPYEWLLKTKFTIKQELIWINGTPIFDKVRFFPTTERIYWLSKGIKTRFYNIMNFTDMFKLRGEGIKGEHKRAYPVELIEGLLKCFIDSKTILDPFLGSGTTMVAAERLGRNSIGIEISKEYCEIAYKRLLNEVRQAKLNRESSVIERVGF